MCEEKHINGSENINRKAMQVPSVIAHSMEFIHCDEAEKNKC